MQDYSLLTNYRTERLLLRKLDHSDMDIAAQIHGDPATNLHSPAGARTREATETLMQTWIDAWEKQGFGYWTVCAGDDANQVLGFGGVMRKQIADFTGLNLYFRFATHAWGTGYASEMGKAALHAAFTVLGEAAVYGLVRPANLPSRRTLERLGMRIWCDVDDVPGQERSLIYRITCAEYLERTSSPGAFVQV